jgi:HK97 family phage prohead protease
MALGFSPRNSGQEQLRRGKDAPALIYRSAAEFGLTSKPKASGAKLSGLAVPYGVLSSPMADFQGKFREEYLPNCFSRSVRDGDLRVCVEHDRGRVLGRQSASTARFWEETDGLHVECDLPDTTTAKDLSVSIIRGDITSMSAAFFILRETWSMQNGERVRSISSGQLLECSVVSFPQYPETHASVASIGDEDDEEEDLLMAASQRLPELAMRSSARVGGVLTLEVSDLDRMRLEILRLG